MYGEGFVYKVWGSGVRVMSHGTSWVLPGTRLAYDLHRKGGILIIRTPP